MCFVFYNKGVHKVTGSHVYFKSGSIMKTVLDKDVETKVHKQSYMLCGHLIVTTVMTLSVRKGHSLIASFFLLTSASRCLSAIAAILVNLGALSMYRERLKLELSNFLHRWSISARAVGAAVQ